MSTNDNTNSKLDTQKNEEAIAEVSAAEADAVAGGIKRPIIMSDPTGPRAPPPPAETM